MRLNVERLARDRRRACATRSRRSSARSGTSRARSSSIGSPQQLGEVLFDKLGLSQEAARQDRLLDRRARAAGDPRRARDRPEDRALARAQPARQDLPRRAARSSSTPSRGSTRPSCRPGATTGRLASTEPEHAERPGAHRAGPRDPRLLRGRARATSCSAPTTRRSSCGSSRTSPTSRCSRRSSSAARTCTPRRPRRSSARTPAELDADGSLEVEDDQLRDRLRPQRLRPRRPAEHPARGGQGVHRRLPRALPARRRVHGVDDRAGARSRAT